jgi:hypothetical protein
MIDEEDIIDALKTAMAYPMPEPLPVPEDVNLGREWTPEKIVALSLNFLGGNISHSALWEEIKEEGTISRSQLRQMLEPIWAMDCIDHQGKQYQTESGKGKTKKLVQISQFPDLPITHMSQGGESTGESTG